MKLFVLLFTSCSLQSGCYCDVQAEPITKQRRQCKPFYRQCCARIAISHRRKQEKKTNVSRDFSILTVAWRACCTNYSSPYCCSFGVGSFSFPEITSSGLIAREQLWPMRRPIWTSLRKGISFPEILCKCGQPCEDSILGIWSFRGGMIGLE